MKKILAVTLNPCIDYTVTLGELHVGVTNRVKSTRKDIAGKGINICNLLKNLDVEVISAGFDYENGIVKDALDKRGIPSVLTTISGSIRTNIKVLDASRGEMTELNEAGGSVAEDKVAEIQQKIFRVIEELEPGSVVCTTGSAPEGVPRDFYARIITKAREHGMFTILDADGHLFEQGLKAMPHMIKPNREELIRFTGDKLQSREEMIRAAKEIYDSGVSMVCVSLGFEGAFLYTGEGCYLGRPANVPIRGVQGVGDAMVGAMANEIMNGSSPESVLRMGMAAASASIQLPGSQMAGPMKLAGLLESIRIEKVL